MNRKVKTTGALSVRTSRVYDFDIPLEIKQKYCEGGCYRLALELKLLLPSVELAIMDGFAHAFCIGKFGDRTLAIDAYGLWELSEIEKEWADYVDNVQAAYTVKTVDDYSRINNIWGAVIKYDLRYDDSIYWAMKISKELDNFTLACGIL